MQPLLCQRVPSDDGAELATDVYLPDGPGPFPTILFRTPYHRIGAAATHAPIFVERGYAFVAQDCRGKYDSDGVFVPLVDEARDGQATLDWIANQRWCNGRIGLWGRSYGGIVQVPAASGGHPALRAICPAVTPASLFRDWIRYDGCFALANTLLWSLTNATCRNRPPMDHFTWEELHRLGTLDEIATRVGFRTPVMADWAAHDRQDEYWDPVDQTAMHARITVPGYHVGGWFDHLTRGTFSAYRGIAERGATDAARAGQKLLVGPWGHRTVSPMGPEHTAYGDWQFGPEADVPVTAQELQCLDHFLRDADNGYDAQPAVKAFLMGENRWLSLPAWPPPGAQARHWHLDSGGGANMRIGDGALRETPPDRSAADTYRFDPADPTPARGGPLFWGLDHPGPADQRPLLERPDVLLYRGERLPRALAVVGDIEAELFVSSEAEDTDLIVKLCVEEASGAIISLTTGTLRLRYRDSWRDPAPLPRGTPVRVGVHMAHLAYVFPAGSRVCLTLASGEFPRIQPHSGTMAPPFSGTPRVVQRNSVYHGPGTASRLTLPILELN